MIAEIGQFCLILAFMFSLVQTGFGVAGLFPRLKGQARFAEGAALAAALVILISFSCLVWAFATSDFSVSNVAANSHTDKPLLYKITATWGSHEGSMLLWCAILLGYGAAVVLTGQGLPDGLRYRALGVQGALGAAFVGFTLFASDPLMRVDPAPFQGLSLNPALQDPALAFHPPLLYLGYVGFSVVFSFAIAALIEGRIDRAWARYVRPWILLAWSFLTAGITLGAFWAYYELGWGGWWAWDPVENASFMPWLAGTAVLHSAIVMERRDSLKAWTILLALMAFTFSMLGAFLVRSGLLTSVHAFAVDPQRGLILMGILGVMTGLGLVLFALRAPELRPGGAFAPISRESSLVLNNLLISASLCSVFLGTVWPLVVQAVFDQAISVGPPYYLMVFGPVMGLAMLVLPVSGLLAWKRADLAGVAQRLMPAFAIAALAAAVGLLAYSADRFVSYLTFYAGVFLGLWVVVGSVRILAERLQFQMPRSQEAWREVLRRLGGLPLATYGMTLAHIGLGVFLIGAVAESHMRQNVMRPLAVEGQVSVAGYDLRMVERFERSGPNYDAQGARFTVMRGGREVCEARPERRFYPASNSWMSEVAMCFTPLDDLYLVLGEPRADTDGVVRPTVRVFHNPLIRLVFLGPVLMILGGLISLFDRRLRLGLPVSARAARKAAS